MSTETVVTPERSASQDSLPRDTQSLRSQFLGLFATGLLMSFFLPWANFFGAKISGFDIQKLGDEHRLLWLIPVFSIITIFSALTRKSQQVAGQLAGATPFLAGIFWYIKLGNDLFQVLLYGGYLCLAFGAGLIVVARNLK